MRHMEYVRHFVLWPKAWLRPYTLPFTHTPYVGVSVTLFKVIVCDPAFIDCIDGSVFALVTFCSREVFAWSKSLFWVLTSTSSSMIRRGYKMKTKKYHYVGPCYETLAPFSLVSRGEQPVLHNTNPPVLLYLTYFETLNSRRILLQ